MQKEPVTSNWCKLFLKYNLNFLINVLSSVFLLIHNDLVFLPVFLIFPFENLFEEIKKLDFFYRIFFSGWWGLYLKNNCMFTDSESFVFWLRLGFR